MSDTICNVCSQLVGSMTMHTIRLLDAKSSHSISGCKECVDRVEAEVKSIKNLHKTKVEDVLKLLNIEK
jgi:hypothetical protein